MLTYSRKKLFSMGELIQQQNYPSIEPCQIRVQLLTLISVGFLVCVLKSLVISYLNLG